MSRLDGFDSLSRRLPTFQQQLKRVSFAILLLGAISIVAHGAWDTNPTTPTFHWGDLREGNIVSDGLGGAFFCFGSYSFTPWQRVGHINADGDFTFVGTTPPWEGLLLADEPGYGSTLDGLTLTRSEPPGTIIACDYRFDLNGVYIGTAFFKFDTLGLTGFERVIEDDTLQRLAGHDRDRPNGDLLAESDGLGGLHFLLFTPSQQGIQPFYYNHLNANGTFTHAWPGIEVPGIKMTPDGCGGVFVLSRNFPTHETWGIRFDQNGIQQWSESRPLTRDGVEGGTEILISPGRLFMPRDSSLGGNQFAHFIFLVDTAGNHLWDPQGIRIAEEFYSQMIGSGSFLADGQGGFFNNRYIAPGPAQAFHFDGNGQVVASNLEGAWIDRADGQGGGYDVRDYGQGNSLSATIWHYNPELIEDWGDSVIALQINRTRWGGDYIAAERNGIIGMVHTIPGVVFYHVNPNGTLGPRLESSQHETTIPNELQIVTAYPNPFNAIVTIEYELPVTTWVELNVYDVLGRQLETLALAQQTPGVHRVHLDGEDLVSGAYFIRLKTASEDHTIKVLLEK